MAKAAPLLASDQDLEQLAWPFRPLASPRRLQILLLLTQGERSVKFLGDELKLSQSALSQHLRMLRFFHIVVTRPSGKGPMHGLAGGATAGKDYLFELPVQNLVVRILPTPKGYPDFDFIWRNHAARS